MIARRRPSPARRAAAGVLREVFERGGRATELLRSRGKNLSDADQGLQRELVLGVLRNRTALDSEIASACRAPLERLAPDLREILEVALYQLRYLERVPAYAAVDEAVRHARESGGEGAAKLVNAVLRALLRRAAVPLLAGAGSDLRIPAADLARRFSHPEFLVARWLERLGGEATRRILATDNAPSGLDLLVNPFRTNRDALAAALAEEGISAEPSPLVPLGLSVISGNPLRSPLFAAGHFSVQDIGSQALPLLLPPGETLLDLAAAPGGKSFAALFSGRARQTIALDRSPARLSLLLENTRRLGIERSLPAAADYRSPPLTASRFSRILLDAPCSGTGTLRKNPEIRYRITEEAIERLSGPQEEALLAAAQLLEPGGLLLYSTCSLEEEENARVVARTLARDSRLKRAEIEAPEELHAFVSGDRFQLLPGRWNDGFTAHLLQRR